MKKRVLNIFSLLATVALGLAGSNANGQTTIYNTPGKYVFTVPVGVTTLTVDVVGGMGGNADGSAGGEAAGGGTGGAAGEVQAVITVTPGSIDTIYVAQNGPSAETDYTLPGGSGYGTGGGGSNSGDGGGGGASAIINASGAPLVVAGGGGGGGANYESTGGGNGGNGGSANGNGTNGANGDGDPASGGIGATQTGPGAGGVGYAGYVGGSGIGANGGTPYDGVYYSGGGGGAGYYGGGAGQYSINSPYDIGGGGGGSSFADPSTNNIVYGTNNAGTPYVKINMNSTAGMALNFNSSNNDYVNISDNPKLNFGAGDFTVEASVQLSGPQSDYSGLVVKDDQGGTVVGWQMVIVGNNIAAEFTDGNTFFGTGNGLQGTTPLNDGKWHHLAMVVSRVLNTITLYVDGNADATLTDSRIGTMNISNHDPLLLGVERTFSVYLNGNEDEVRIWNRALCSQELVNDTNGELQLPQTGLVAYYKFNQGVAGGTNTGITSLVDSSGNGLNGGLDNFSLTGGTDNFVSPGVKMVTYNGIYAPVFATPEVTITGNQGCYGNSTTLMASGTNVTSYLWSDGSTSSASATFGPLTSATADTLTISNGVNGCTVSIAQPITVSFPAASAINIGTYASSYMFKGTNETASGHYTFDTTSAGGCDSMINLYLTLYNTPTISGSCAPTNLTLSGSPTPVYIQWQKNGNNAVADTAKWDTSKIVCQDGLINQSTYAFALDTAGNIYVANNFTDVVKYPKNSTAATKGVVVARNGISGIQDIKVDIAGNIFVEDYNLYQVLEFPAGSDSTTAPKVVASGFSSPGFMFVDNAGNIYLSDDNIQGVWYYPVGDTIGTIVAQNGLSGAAGVFVDNSGKLYVSDYNNYDVLAYPKGSNASTPGTIVAQGNIPNIYGIDGLDAITVDGNGNIFVCTPINNPIRGIDSSVIYIFAPGSTQTTPAIDSIVIPGMYWSYFFAVNANGDVYASNAYNDYVKKYTNKIKMTDSVTMGGSYTAHVVSFSGGSITTAADVIGERTASAMNIGTYAPTYTFKGNVETASGRYTFDTTNVSGCDSMVNLYLTMYNQPVLTTSSTCVPAKLTVSGYPMPYMVNWKNATDTAKWDAGTVVVSKGITGNLIGMTTDTAGNYYVGISNEVLMYPKNSTTSIAGVVVAQKGINSLDDVRVDIAGNIFVADDGLNQVLEYPAGSDSTTTPKVVASGFSSVEFLTVDNADNIYLTDYNNKSVDYYAAGDTNMVIVAQNGLSQPLGLYVDNKSNIYVVNNYPSEVIEYPKGSGTSGTGTIVAEAGFSNYQPAAVSLDGNGNIYVATWSGPVYIYPAGSTATTAPIDSIMPGTLNSLSDMSMDINGNVYLSDYYNNNVLKYSNIITLTDSAKTGGNYSAHVVSFSGSDSTTAIVTLGAADTSVLNRTVCDSLRLNGTKYTSSGTFTQVITNKSGCDSTITLNLTVNTSPTLSVTGKDSIPAGGTDTLVASGATTYSWTGGGVKDSLIVMPSNNTTYTVTGTTNGCSSTATFTVKIEVLSGVQAIAQGGDVKLYPNPASTYVNISFSTITNEAATVTIVSENGEVVSAGNTTISNGKTMPIDITNLASGIYFVRINTATQSQVVRFVKAK